MPWIGTLPPYFCTRKVENDRAPAFAQLYCAGRQTALCFERKSTRKVENDRGPAFVQLYCAGQQTALCFERKSTRKVENDRGPAFVQLYCAGQQTALCFERKSTRKQTKSHYACTHQPSCTRPDGCHNSHPRYYLL